MTVLLRAKHRTNGGTRLAPRTRHQTQTQPLPSQTAATAEPALRPLGTDRRTLPNEDRATYNCGCGYVFSHDVSTSVACPHCGDAQAW